MRPQRGTITFCKVTAKPLTACRMKIIPLDLTRQEQANAEIDDFDQKRVWSPSIIRYESAACHNVFVFDLVLCRMYVIQRITTKSCYLKVKSPNPTFFAFVEIQIQHKAKSSATDRRIVENVDGAVIVYRSQGIHDLTVTLLDLLVQFLFGNLEGTFRTENVHSICHVLNVSLGDHSVERSADVHQVIVVDIDAENLCYLFHNSIAIPGLGFEVKLKSYRVL